MGCALSVITALFTSSLYFCERFASFTLCGIMCCAILSAAGLSIMFGVALGYHYSVAEDIVTKQKIYQVRTQLKKDQARGVGVTPAKGPASKADYGGMVSQISIAAATVNATARRRRDNDSFTVEPYRGDKKTTPSFFKVSTAMPDLPFKLNIPRSKAESGDIPANEEDTADVSPDKYDTAEDPDKYDTPSQKNVMAEGSSLGRRDMDDASGDKAPFVPAVNWWRGVNITNAPSNDNIPYDEEYKEYDDDDSEVEEGGRRLKRDRRRAPKNDTVSPEKRHLQEWLQKYRRKHRRLFAL